MHITRCMRTALAAALVATGPSVAGAQARPDFSGEWVLNRQESRLPPLVSNVESGVVRIEHREPSFGFHRTYVIAGAPREAGFSRRTDGAESSETGPQGLVTVSTLRWSGTALVLAMRIKTPAGDATNDV